MKDTILAIVIVVLLIVGFWWTRGAGGLPGGINDPTTQQRQRFDQMGDPVGVPEEHADREPEIE